VERARSARALSPRCRHPHGQSPRLRSAGRPIASGGWQDAHRGRTARPPIGALPDLGAHRFLRARERSTLPTPCLPDAEPKALRPLMKVARLDALPWLWENCNQSPQAPRALRVSVH
jgi:hypothetical protein